MLRVRDLRSIAHEYTAGRGDGAGPVDGAEIPKSACDPNMALESNIALEAKNLAANEM